MTKEVDSGELVVQSDRDQGNWLCSLIETRRNCLFSLIESETRGIGCAV